MANIEWLELRVKQFSYDSFEAYEELTGDREVGSWEEIRGWIEKLFIQQEEREEREVRDKKGVKWVKH